MLRLAFDTSTEVLSVALACDEVVHERHEVVGHRHAELLLPTVQALLAAAGKTLPDVEAIGFGAGPGAFTGLRVACGVAQGLALALRCSLAPIDSFSAIAEAVAAGDDSQIADASGADAVFVAIDARMGEVYAAELARAGGDWVPVAAPVVCRPDEVPLPEAARVVGAGTGFAAYESALRDRLGDRLVSIRPALTPRATVMLRVLDRALARGVSIDPEAAVPVYLRDQVAFTIAERERRRSSAGRPA